MSAKFDWRKEVPESWVPLIEADDWLRESFDEFTYEYEPVPEFLIQDLRGGAFAADLRALWRAGVAAAGKS